MTGEKLADPQARHLLATGAEAEALEAAFQARIEKAYSAEFHRKMDAYIDAIVAEIEANERGVASNGGG